jgi:arylsulfatase A-like enzyme
LALTEFVAHQESNISTDFVSAIESIGLDRVEFGLHKPEYENPDHDSLEVRHGLGRLGVFSADGDLVGLDLEAGLPPWESNQKLRMIVRLNGKWLRRITLTPGFDAYRIDIPSDIAVRGRNRLEFQTRPNRRQLESDLIPTALVRRVRFRAQTGRDLWPDRPDRIRFGASQEPGPTSTIEMPTAGYLDMVVEVPSEGFLLGSITSQPAPNEDDKSIEIYVHLADSQPTETVLFSQERRAGRSRVRPFRCDLTAWVGQTVRLRFGVTGPANAVVSWRDVRVVGSTPDHGVDLDPIIRAAPPPATGRLGQPNVVVILLDAARADAFSPFGSERSTPALERLSKDGTKFTNAISPSPWTGQSVPSILTGLFADTLGIGAWSSPLPDSVPTLAELMSRAGYRTVLWSQHPIYRNRQGLRRGFDESVRSPRSSYNSVPAPDLLFDDERPTFAWLHFIPPHTPYRPPAPFLGSYSSWYVGGTSVEATFLSQFPHKIDPKTLSGDDRRFIRDRYLENAAFADHLVGRVIDTMDNQGRYESSMIVVLSDHGEGFLEHGSFLHTRHVYREFLNVPFVIKWPAGIGLFRSTVDDIVPLVDLLPTLVDGLTLESHDATFQGRTLLPVVLDHQAREGPFYAVTRGDHDRSKPPRPEAMFDRDGWRLIYDALTDRGRLFRYSQDPEEQRDLAHEYPMKALQMRQSVLRQMADNKTLLGHPQVDSSESELDPEVIEQLEALGYLD